MGKDEIKAIAKIAALEVIAELKGHKEPPVVCCGGLSTDEADTVKAWAQDGGFTEKQMDGLKVFADALIASRRYIFYGVGIIAIITLRESWMSLLKWIKEHLSG